MKPKTKEWRNRVVAMLMSVLTFIMSLAGETVFAEEQSTTEDVLVGDTDYDGELTSSDAYIILKCYSWKAVGLDVGDVDMDVFDVDRDNSIGVNDAYLVLLYYSQKAVGLVPQWPPVIEPENPDSSTTDVATTTTVTTDDNSMAFFIGDYLSFSGKHCYIRSEMDATNDENTISVISYGDIVRVLGIERNGWYVVKKFDDSDEQTIGYVRLNNNFQKVSDLTTETTTSTIESTTTTSTTESTTTTSTIESTTTTSTIESTTTTSTTESTTTTSTTETTTAEYSFGDVVNLVEDSCNMYDSVDGNVIGILEKDQTFVIIQKIDTTWYQIISDNEFAFVKVGSTAMEVTSSSSLKSQPIEDVKVTDILQFTSEKWYVRDDQGNAVGQLKKNQLLVVLEKNDSLLKILTDDGVEGYIYWTDYSNEIFTLMTLE